MWDTLSKYKTGMMIYGLGLFAFIAGMSKLASPELAATWGAYNPEWALELIPFAEGTWMQIVGGIETLAGVALLSHWKPHLWAGVIALWLLGVTFAVWTAGFYDIAFRDLGLALFAVVTSIEAYQVYYE